MNILFLYTELADYTIACLKALKKKNITVAVVHYPVNSEAPFMFNFKEIGDFRCIYDFKSFSEFRKFVEVSNPQKIIISGWANKWYVKLCLLKCNRIECILTMDNHWEASLKQRLLSLFTPLFLSSVFKKIWIPGNPQLQYARKLGFKKSNVIEGFYSCDTDFYSSLGKETYINKSLRFPKKLLCVARYIPVKNYTLLWEVFINWKAQTNNDWELWCAGAGADFEARVKHPSIHHLGFVQKNEWKEIIQHTGVFILPSLMEPWGVVVHEFAAAGYPLILSDKVGAASAFLTDQNGWSFDPQSKNELMKTLRKLDSTDDNELIKMGMKSMQLAKKITPEQWSFSLLSEEYSSYKPYTN